MTNTVFEEMNDQVKGFLTSDHIFHFGKTKSDLDVTDRCGLKHVNTFIFQEGVSGQKMINFDYRRMEGPEENSESEDDESMFDYAEIASQDENSQINEYRIYTFHRLLIYVVGLHTERQGLQIESQSVRVDTAAAAAILIRTLPVMNINVIVASTTSIILTTLWTYAIIRKQKPFKVKICIYNIYTAKSNDDNNQSYYQST
jgi:hypothetical protein